MIEKLKEKAIELGAFKTGVVEASEIRTDAYFRKMCADNVCGNYGRSYMCPPDIGPIDELMAKVKTFDKVLVYQTVGELEDSYDFEGMMEAGERHNKLAQKLWDLTDEMGCKEVLHLGAGGCKICSVCGKKTGDPCRYPARAMGSLEAYGINVSELASLAGMRYINGKDTVTYFGAVFFKEQK